MSVAVRILQLPPATLLALAAGDLASAQAGVDVSLTAYLVAEESVGTWQYRTRQAVESPADLPWITGLLVDVDSGAVVGKAGFHAAPDDDGLVEIGYAVDPACRRRGYARAAFALMLDRARRSPEVRTFRATVSPGNTASRTLIEPFGLLHVGEQWDDEDGLELVYELAV
ncbi:MAG: GNAT family N-acetyltransferase [Actinobacteria bacterium]|uniref:Unannotated protein n=1 Tax=freshwater metagenome TaxID=449393 RepID=A0A6J6RZH6_9ZZZZ|nr:GNAT family N-acetyltransferase [Actinomycetota bacterium]